MPNSLKCKVKHLRHNGTLTERECDRILKALEQEPCDDCISREAVLEQINCWIGSGEYRYTNATHYLTRRVQDIPSVTPKAEFEKEEPAEWIVNTDESHRWDRVRFYCSACNGWNTYGRSKHCPNCGRRMRKGEEDEQA